MGARHRLSSGSGASLLMEGGGGRPSPKGGGGGMSNGGGSWATTLFLGFFLGVFFIFIGCNVFFLTTTFDHSHHLQPSFVVNHQDLLNLGAKINMLRSRTEGIQHGLAFWRKERGYKALQSDPQIGTGTTLAEVKHKAEALASSATDQQPASESLPPSPSVVPVQPRLRKASSAFSSSSPGGARSLLVVGGTDGSGTRSFVDLLNDLGVPMAVDDAGTMDVHGWEMTGGWPPSIKKVLAVTHSADYEVDQLPGEVQMIVKEELHKFLTAKEREMGPEMRRHHSTDVKWGFKAPVAMLVVPFMHKMAGGLKFLHVVRDGRDISFSGNQSPVDKFYSHNYGLTNPGEDPYQGKPQVQAIRLWSDWNVDMTHWAQTHTSTEGTTFDYLRLRTEDLVNPETKYDTYMKLARFIGSKLTPDQVCCLVRRPTVFMGSHDSQEQQAPSSSTGDAAVRKLKSRYGAWREKVRGNPELKRELEEVGGPGLETFGYFDDHSNEIEFPSSQCTEEVQCSFPAGGLGLKVEAPPDSDLCKYQSQVDLRGPSVDLDPVEAYTAEECCQICQNTPRCQFFSFSASAGTCYPKHSHGTEVPNHLIVSGSLTAIASA